MGADQLQRCPLPLRLGTGRPSGLPRTVRRIRRIRGVGGVGGLRGCGGRVVGGGRRLEGRTVGWGGLGQPVAAALEGVGRQRDPAGVPVGERGGEHGGPVDGGAVDVCFGERGDEPVEAALVTTERAHVDGLVAGRFHGFPHPRPRTVRLISMKIRWPWPSSPSTAWSKRTVCRRLLYQYPASSAEGSSGPPSIDEWNGMSVGNGVMPGSVSRSLVRIPSIWVECEA